MVESAATSRADAPVPVRLRWSGSTDTGRSRKNNEDAFLALGLDAREVFRLGKEGEAALEHRDFVFAVSDGMGGHRAGDFASRVVVDKITQLLPAIFRLDTMGLRRGSGDILEHLFGEIHRAIVVLGRAYEECRGMGATLSLCWFQPGWMHFCHIGDSRIYYLPAKSGVRRLTEDHTYAGWLVRTGRIREAEARFHPGRHRLSQALAAGLNHPAPQHGAVGYEPGDRFLVCSDGLTEGLSPGGIEHLLREPPERVRDVSPAAGLVRESVQLSGKDNTTALVVEVASRERASSVRPYTISMASP